MAALPVDLVMASMTEILSRHQIQSRGVTRNTPDRCTCDFRPETPSYDESLSNDWRKRLFARHQAEMIAKEMGMLT